jgi:hypothetical protein
MLGKPLSVLERGRQWLELVVVEIIYVWELFYRGMGALGLLNSGVPSQVRENLRCVLVLGQEEEEATADVDI